MNTFKQKIKDLPFYAMLIAFMVAHNVWMGYRDIKRMLGMKLDYDWN